MKTKEKVIALLNHARENGVYPFLDNERLRLKINRNEQIDAALLDNIKLYKDEITLFLTEEAGTIKESQVGTPPIIPFNREDVLQIPLSFSQERLWFIDKLKGSENYHISLVLNIQGKPEINFLEMAFRSIIHRHEALRTVFVEKDGIAFQQIMTAEKWRLSYSGNVSGGKEEEEIITSEINTPFDLAKDYMVRAHLLQFKDQEHALVVVIHHIASDAWSMPIFIRELVSYYKAFVNNSPAGLPALPVQYADYSLWQKLYLTGAFLDKKLQYWKEKLAGIGPLNLPTDHPRPAVQSFRGKACSFVIEKQVNVQLGALCREHGATLFTALLTVFKVMLYRYTGTTDITVGIPVANRTQQEILPLIGFFVNTLVLRTNLEQGIPFIDLLERVKKTTLEAYQYQEAPFEKVVEKLLTQRDMSRSPLFQVMFVYHEKGLEEKIELDDLQLSVRPLEKHTSKFDLNFIVEQREEESVFSIEYSSDLFEEETILRMGMHFNALLSAIARDPKQKIGRLKMLTPEEEKCLLNDFNDTKTTYPANKTIIDLFEEQVRKTPDHIAIAYETTELTYAQVNAGANRLAAYLRQRYHIRPEELVAVKLPRNEWLIITLLGILKSGAAYVPVDPEYPAERINYMITDSGCKLVIDEALLQQVKEAQHAFEATDLPAVNTPSNLAYVIYTSGSTGAPKGVMISHKNVYTFISWCKQEFCQADVDTVFAGTSISFDLSVFEIFFTLCNGKKLRLLNNALSIPDWLSTSDKILLNTVPSVVGALLADKTDLQSVKVLNMAGEPVPPHYLHRLDITNTEIRNLYGPSEDTTYSTVYRIKQKKPILIGQPIANTDIYILNENLDLQPIGIPGEICIGGDGLSRGYINRDELTAEKFVSHPFKKGAKLYKTGDLGKWTADGNIDFLGRLDDQVKIRGYRIEPGEIEVALRAHPQIEAAVVNVSSDKQGNKQMVAYLVSATPVNPVAIRNYLQHILPIYMLPAQFVQLDRLPLTSSGKVDKRKLPALDDVITASQVAYTPPGNMIEEKLVQIWQEILAKDNIGIHDNFFELGGHSLIATRVMARITRELNVQLPIAVLFTHSTVSLLAEKISAQNVQEATFLIPVQIQGTRLPVFCAPPAGGNVLLYYELSKALGADQPLYAFQAPGVDLISAPLTSVQEMAALYIKEMQKIQPHGPYTLMGYSFGGNVIYEMAIRLQQQGFKVAQLIIFDSVAPDKSSKNYNEMLPATYTDWILYFKDIYNVTIENNDQKIMLTAEELFQLSPADQLKVFYNRLSEKEKGITFDQLRAYTDVYRINASISYVPERNDPVDVPIVLFRAVQTLTALSEAQIKKRNELLEGRAGRKDFGWGDFTINKIHVHEIDCSHLNMMDKSNILTIVAKLKQYLN
jgi:amino acid adenylation domain-containing protein